MAEEEQDEGRLQWLRSRAYRAWGVLLIVLLFLVLWFFVALQVTVTQNGLEPSLYSGDRVIVSRLSYGWHTPFSPLFGRHVLAYSPADSGDWIAFRNPMGQEGNIDDRALMLGHCCAVPGDTIWFSWSRRLVDAKAQCRPRYPFVVPGRNVEIEVTPWNARLLCNTLNRHEGIKATLSGDSLLVSGRVKHTVRFSKDYFWVSSPNPLSTADSRYYGFVPEDHLVGRALFVSFSKDPQSPFYSGFRSDRCLIGIKSQ